MSLLVVLDFYFFTPTNFVVVRSYNNKKGGVMIKKEILEKVAYQILEGNEIVLKTGFRDLDEVLSGVEKSSVITIGARPAMGKTCFMTSIMFNLLEQNKKCLYFSLEMSEEQLLTRLLAQVGEIDAQMMHNKAAMAMPKYIEKFVNALNKIKDYDLTISDDANHIEQIKEGIEKEKPEFVFIDYLQLIQYSGRKSRVEQIDEIMRSLKTIAKENDCMIFLTSQLSRALESRYDKRPLLSDLRESGSIENLSDVVIFIHRDDYYNSADDEDYALNKGKADIIVAKNKYGPTCAINLLFRCSIMKFLEPVKNELF